MYSMTFYLISDNELELDTSVLYTGAVDLEDKEVNIYTVVYIYIK